MPATEQERRCLSAICEYLKQTSGRDWQVKHWLDDRHHNERNPDALLTDGTDDIAIEIKQLTDGDTFHTHHRSQESLFERLAPNPTRTYVLFPPPSLRLPLDHEWVKRIKSRIAIAVAELRVGDAVVLPIPRRATVRFCGQFDVGLVFCEHARSDEVSAVSPGVDGLFILEDGGEPDHQFLSEESRSEFRRALKQTCEDSILDGRAVIEWCEEWTLQRDRDSADGEAGVLVITAVADFLESAAIESVEKEIQAARKKFAARTWAERTAVALHAGEQQHELTPALFEAAIDRLEAADLHPLDSVFLVKGEQVRSWPSLGTPPSA